jgi:hypothetical protein
MTRAEYSIVDPAAEMPDPLVNVHLEEAVLSSMASGTKVNSLEPHHFTSKVRKTVYLLMRSGVQFDDLDVALANEGMRAELGYVADLFCVPLLPHQPLRDAVAELKRLHLMRRFCADVEGWLRAAPGLDWSVALKRLGEVIRRQGMEATKELSPRLLR